MLEESGQFEIGDTGADLLLFWTGPPENDLRLIEVESSRILYSRQRDGTPRKVEIPSRLDPSCIEELQDLERRIVAACVDRIIRAAYGP